MRGYKLGLLTTADYNNLCQCETLEDIKLYLVRTGHSIDWWREELGGSGG